MAKMGKHIEPVLSDVKEMGASLLEDLEEPMANIAGYIRSDLIPALKNFGSWVSQNIPLIKAGLAGVTTGIIAYKTAAYSAKLATEGLTIATKAAEVAQKLFSAAQAATPWGAIALAVGAVVGAIVYFSSETENAVQKVDILTEEERELVGAIDETVTSFREQKAALDEAMQGSQAQMGHLTDLSEELQTLADKNGVVQDGDKARAQFILNELNDALGTEYTMIGNVIQQYDALQAEIADLIEGKKAQLLLEANEQAYVEAIQNKATAWKTVVAAEKDYLAQKEITDEAERIYVEHNEQYQARLAEAKTRADYEALSSDALKNSSLLDAWEREKSILAEKETAYAGASEVYGGYASKIMQYEDASTAYLEENYEKSSDILTDKGGLYQDYANTVYIETQNAIQALEDEAVQAAAKAAKTKSGFEAGINGFTEDMVKEAEQGYEDAFSAYANAYTDAYGVGGDLGEGLEKGLADKKSRPTTDRSKHGKQHIFNMAVGCGYKQPVQSRRKDIRLHWRGRGNRA